MQLPIQKLRPFENHPFQVKDDDEMNQLVWSVLTQGVLTPLVVRPLENDEYEVISGHRRLHACQKAGIKTVPALIYALDRDAAAIALVDSNLHREKILPSEKAFAYKLKMDAMSRQGHRTDLTSRQVVGKLETADLIAENESGRQVQRYIRLTELITGTSAEKRPEFMRMMEDAKKHRFDMILTREVSRFARNTVDTLQYTRMLKEHGVEVYFINDGIKTFDGDGELRLTIMATLAQDESRKTSVRVKSGQQTSMNNGVYYGNGNILGYDRVEQILPDRTKEVDFVINPEQAETVRLIFDLYLDGWGLSKIKDELERRGRKTSQGMDSWHPTVISRILKNTFYCGILTYHKEYTPDYLKQKKVKNYGEMELTQVQGRHEPIVTEEEFERVQRIMAQKRTECKNLNEGPRAKGKKPRTTVWGKLLICECGHTFNTRRWDRADRQPGNAYQCYASVRTGSYESRKKKGLPLEGICRSPMIPEWRLQMMANLIFRDYLAEKDKVLALANSILESYNEENIEKRSAEALIATKQRELARLSKKMDNYIEMWAEGDLSRELFRTKCAELEPQMQQLQKEIEMLSQQVQPKPVANYKEKLTVLQYALERYTHIDEGQNVPESVVEAFVVKIVVHPDSFDWYLRFNDDPDKPLHCTLEGKRKQTTKIMVSGGNSPTMDYSDTGCHQEPQIIKNKIRPVAKSQFCTNTGRTESLP